MNVLWLCEDIVVLSSGVQASEVVPLVPFICITNDNTEPTLAKACERCTRGKD